MCFRIGDRIGKDAYEIMKWPVTRIYEYIAFYQIEQDELNKVSNSTSKDSKTPISFEKLLEKMEKEGLLENGK